jgi:hypothetical protein
MTDSPLISRAMLAGLSIGSWGATKTDKDASNATAELYGAKKDSGKYIKRLMPKGENSYQRLQSHIAAVRVLNSAQTLAWSDDGWRLLPILNYTNYTNLMREAKHTYDTLLSTLIADYPTLKAQAIQEATEEAVRTGNPRRLLSESDFPTNVRGEYSFAIEYNPVPSGGDFRVQLSQEEIDIIATRTENRIKDAFEDAHKDAVKRLYEVVYKMHETLSQPEAIFRDSLVGNAQKLCDVLTRLNISGDMQLETLRKATESLATVQPATLRNDTVTRIQTANEAQGILDSMLSVYGKGIAQ